MDFLRGAHAALLGAAISGAQKRDAKDSEPEDPEISAAARRRPGRGLRSQSWGTATDRTLIQPATQPFGRGPASRDEADHQSLYGLQKPLRISCQGLRL